MENKKKKISELQDISIEIENWNTEGKKRLKIKWTQHEYTMEKFHVAEYAYDWSLWGKGEIGGKWNNGQFFPTIVENPKIQ